MMDDEEARPQLDMFSEINDLSAARHLVAELHDELGGKVSRLRYISDLRDSLGSEGTMLSGGTATYGAWVEAQSSFVHGNYIATILLCQSLIENLLASTVHDFQADDSPKRKAQLGETLIYCTEKEIISRVDSANIRRLMEVRNPLTHFRPLSEGSNVDNRAVKLGIRTTSLIEQDARFAIGLAVQILSRPQFRIG